MQTMQNTSRIKQATGIVGCFRPVASGSAGEALQFCIRRRKEGLYRGASTNELSQHRLQKATVYIGQASSRRRCISSSILRDESRATKGQRAPSLEPEALASQWTFKRRKVQHWNILLRRTVTRYSQDIVGLSLAFFIFVSWASTLWLLFCQPDKMIPSIFGNFGTNSMILNGTLSVVSVISLMAIRIWLTTGLFVTVHDAIHGVVSPNNLKVNHAVGTIFAFCYASFSYKLLYRDHWRHHRSPTAVDDPDWYAGGFWKWIAGFLGHYSTPWQLFWESFQFWSMCALGYRFFDISFSVMVLRVAIIWAIPALLSGMQLFYFGTFLPHCNNPGGDFHARSNDWHFLLSLITCYHFGACHEEHHAFPWVPWWELPYVRAQVKRESGGVEESQLLKKY